MGISKAMAAAVAAAGLLATSNCSRAGADEAGEVREPAVKPERVRLESAIPGVTLVAATDLPRSPESGVVDEYCEGYRAKTLTATGRAVEAQGWIVTSEAALGRYRVVSFVSGFDPSTSAICLGRNANIGVFDGTRLAALAYAPPGSDGSPGAVEPMENGALLVWGADGPGAPLGELHLDGDRPRLTALAPEQTFCGRTATVPNVYGQPIEAARKVLIAHGWRPSPPQASEAEFLGVERMTERGVVEAHACSGTGMGYCAFEYRGAGGVLHVTTAGDEDRVLAAGVTCPGDEEPPAG